MWLKYIGVVSLRTDGEPTWTPQEERDMGGKDLSGYPPSLFERIYTLDEVAPKPEEPAQKRGRPGFTGRVLETDDETPKTAKPVVEEPDTEGTHDASEEAR